MATLTTGVNGTTQLPQATTAARAQGNSRVAALRSWMLALVSASVAFGVLAGLVMWQANVATYNYYHAIVDEGSVSVDAALLARAAALDHMSAAATYLETTGQNQQSSATSAANSWNTFNSQLRVSWRNLTDPVQGESNVFAAADSSATDYIQQIGSMFGYEAAGQKSAASNAFLQARQTMNTRLVPALGGLEEVKVEGMGTAYSGADARINGWRTLVLVVGALLAVAFLAMLLAVRRMHYRWSWPVGAALLAAVLLTVLTQVQLTRAVSDARIMVNDAYSSVSGVQDLAALLSQERALGSIMVFDPQGIDQHLADFDQYNTLVEQRLCGPSDCTSNSFLGGNDIISSTVISAALAEQNKLGLPFIPLVANVAFGGQAAQYEQLRQSYRAWLASHNTLVSQVRAGQLSDAANTSIGGSAQAFATLKTSTDAATGIARSEFNNIWSRNYTFADIGQALALVFPIGGALAAWGLWQRRRELLG